MQRLTDFESEYVPQVEECFTTFLTRQSSEDHLTESMLYSLQAGGKRFRPMLLLAVLEDFGIPIEQGHIEVASALEMIHTYSLIHDDLPAMDDDDLRRGKPTNHKVYGEALAILAGDGLLTEAFHLIGESALDEEQKVYALTQLAKAAGSVGMVAGQVADMEGEQKQLDLAELQAVHARKTGALIEFAVLTAGYFAQANFEQMTELMQLARQLGIAFQIRDDLLDVVGDERVLGKKTGMDDARNKSTYPALLGLAGAQKALAEAIQEMEAGVQRLFPTTTYSLVAQVVARVEKVE